MAFLMVRVAKASSETRSVTHKAGGRMQRAIPSSDAIAQPISSPSPYFSGCRQLALKCWDRGIDSRLQEYVQYGLQSCHWHKRRHRTLCLRRRVGPGTWWRCGIVQAIDSITSGPVGEKEMPVCVVPLAPVLALQPRSKVLCHHEGRIEGT